MSEALVAVDLPVWVDPADAFAALFADAPHAYWLDAGPDAATGSSWMGTGFPDDPAGVRETLIDPHGSAGFRGGWVGWWGYDEAAGRAGAPARHDDRADAPQLWLRVDRVIAFDHAARRVTVHAPAEAAARLVTALRAVVASPPALALHDQTPLVARARHTPEHYAALIERCRDAIRGGDAYQLCLTTRFEVEGAVDPLPVYLRLRQATPAHHGGFVRSGRVALLSASPEQFLEVAGDGGAAVVRTKPIKGTRPRGADAAADAALAAELRANEKERAENVMIVDLMRNDLSRVCEPGSVGVDALLEVESYPAVHQLVSTVSGALVAGTTVGALLDATFPAGSMTGAPKLSAMTILERLEQGPRGVFAGCFGWVGDDGTLDLAMVIRSIVVHPGGAYVGAGGGITWRSDAAAEVAEVGIKARGPLGALGASLPPGW
ncbi:MAG: anthranilate synthase component I family protein [Microbacterium sp.]|uniref:anthranilate synthase component I family protein n=1 Tax=Microbacterium sp. TaxID=51671 RepID=UPI003F81CDAD